MSVLERHIKAFATKRLCVLRDDIGDGRSVLVAPAQDISPARVNRILSTTGGLTFVALSPDRAAAFMLSPMVKLSSAPSQQGQGVPIAQYTSVEAREGVSTGISAADRATTIRALGDTQPHPRSLVKPGHIFPVVTKSGGSLVKAEIPEASLDIVVLAGFSDAALFVDFLDRSGALVSGDAATTWAEANDLPVISISQIIQHRLAREPLVVRLSEADLPTRDAGTVRVIAYRSKIHDVEHVALVKGALKLDQPVLVRVQVENAVADIFGGQAPATRQQITGSLRALNEHGSGVFLYLRRSSLAEFPLFGLVAGLQSPPALPATAAMREYGVGAQILRDLGISQIELLSSTQKNLVGLDSFGISVVAQRPIFSQGAANQEHPHG
jgi:3,4-dihydroxy 2-butanone 4-phosphate synthase/GTP cyclohydrolase II